RPSPILGGTGSAPVRNGPDLAAGRRDGALFTAALRRPVHVSDLAAGLLELAAKDALCVTQLAGAHAVTR
ncbi:dTDP-4-dehydrorhamnose reductase, partial [Streptomyces lavendulocolor]